MKRIILLIMAVFILAAAPVHGVVEHPLLSMLKSVPNSSDLLRSIPIASYVDYRAVEDARGIDRLTLEVVQANRFSFQLWRAAAKGIISGPDFIQSLFMNPEDVSKVMGFSFLDVDRGLVFGTPPQTGLILQGDFDLARLEAAYEAREFTQAEIKGVPVWCSPNGCDEDEGMRISFADRQLEDWFGGNLGRREPRALLPNGFVFNSPSLILLEAMIDTQQGNLRSFAELPSILAAAEVMVEEGVLRQAQFYNGLDLGLLDLGFGSQTDSTVTEALDKLRERMEAVGGLPAYGLLALADKWTADEETKTQTALILLVYNSRESAEKAAEVYPTLYENAFSLRESQPFATLISQRGGVLNTPYVYESESTGWFVTVIEIDYPMPDNNPDVITQDYLESSAVFKLLITSIYSRDNGLFAYQYGQP